MVGVNAMPSRKNKSVAGKAVKRAVKKVDAKRKKRTAETVVRAYIGKKRPVGKRGSGLKPAGDLKIAGEVSHYFSRVRAAVVLLKIPIAVGDVVRIKGKTTDFKQKVLSIQIDRQTLEKAVPGDEIGLLVESRVRVGDIVTKV